LSLGFVFPIGEPLFDHSFIFESLQALGSVSLSLAISGLAFLFAFTFEFAQYSLTHLIAFQIPSFAP